MSLALWGYPGLVNGIIECIYRMCNLWNMLIIISQAIYSGALGSWDAEFLGTFLLVKMLMNWSPWFSACIQLYVFVNLAQVFLICVRLKHACTGSVLGPWSSPVWQHSGSVRLDWAQLLSRYWDDVDILHVGSPAASWPWKCYGILHHINVVTFMGLHGHPQRGGFP